MTRKKVQLGRVNGLSRPISLTSVPSGQKDNRAKPGQSGAFDKRGAFHPIVEKIKQFFI